MMIEPPSAAVFLPFVRQANIDYRYFDSASEVHISELASLRMKRGLALYHQDVTPADVEGLVTEMQGNPLLALQTIIERTHFLWRCEREMEAIAPKSNAKRFFPALHVRFCAFCPPSRAGQKLTILAEEIRRHPLLDCSLPACNGSAYTVTPRKLEEAGYQPLPPA